jgi:XTP/dITP diphosphohydrolase
MKKILFGSFNKNKLNEIRAIAADKLKVLSLSDMDSIVEVAETGTTLEENARLKALGYFQQSGIPCFADDSGLEILALDGKPGVYSARYAGPTASEADNVRLVLEQLKDTSNRAAVFKTVIAYCNGSESIRFFEGTLNGRIAASPVGNQGFGYDPIFIPDGENRTIAQMDASEKNAISHRKQALHRFLLSIDNI